MMIFLLLPLTALANLCGSVVNSNLTLKEDLICESETESVLTVVKKGVIINGNGFKIIAPQAHTKIRVLSDNVLINNVNLVGNGTGIGIEIYNVKNAAIFKSVINDHNIGIDEYSNSHDCGELAVVGNNITRSKTFAIRINAKHCRLSPFLEANDLSYTGDYALSVNMKKVYLTSFSKNNLDFSRNGIYLSGDKVNVQGFSLNSANIGEKAIFIEGAKKVIARDLNLSGEMNTGEGLHIYNSEKILIDNVIADHREVGIKIAGEARKIKSLEIINSRADHNTMYGLFITSYGASWLKKLALFDSSFSYNYRGRMIDLPLGKVKIDNVIEIGNREQ